MAYAVEHSWVLSRLAIMAIGDVEANNLLIQFDLSDSVLLLHPHEELLLVAGVLGQHRRHARELLGVVLAVQLCDRRLILRRAPAGALRRGRIGDCASSNDLARGTSFGIDSWRWR